MLCTKVHPVITMACLIMYIIGNSQAIHLMPSWLTPTCSGGCFALQVSPRAMEVYSCKAVIWWRHPFLGQKRRTTLSWCVARSCWQWRGLLTWEYPGAGTPWQLLISTLDCPRVGGRGVGTKHKDFWFVCVDMVPPCIWIPCRAWAADHRGRRQ